MTGCLAGFAFFSLPRLGGTTWDTGTLVYYIQFSFDDDDLSSPTQALDRLSNFFLLFKVDKNY